jgi:hypothetical protein
METLDALQRNAEMKRIRETEEKPKPRFSAMQVISCMLPRRKKKNVERLDNFDEFEIEGETDFMYKVRVANLVESKRRREAITRLSIEQMQAAPRIMFANYAKEAPACKKVPRATIASEDSEHEMSPLSKRKVQKPKVAGRYSVTSNRNSRYSTNCVASAARKSTQGRGTESDLSESTPRHSLYDLPKRRSSIRPMSSSTSQTVNSRPTSGNEPKVKSRSESKHGEHEKKKWGTLKYRLLEQKITQSPPEEDEMDTIRGISTPTRVLQSTSNLDRKLHELLKNPERFEPSSHEKASKFGSLLNEMKITNTHHEQKKKKILKVAVDDVLMCKSKMQDISDILVRFHKNNLKIDRKVLEKGLLPCRNIAKPDLRIDNEGDGYDSEDNATDTKGTSKIKHKGLKRMPRAKRYPSTQVSHLINVDAS